MEKQPLLNTYVNSVDMDEAANFICDRIDRKQKSYVVAINIDVVTKIEHDKTLGKIVNEADMVLVDGQPLVWIAKWHKHPVKERISGSDLVPYMCEKANERGFSIFIIGGKEGVAEKAKANLEKKHANIKVVGTYSPPLGFEKNEQEIERINNKISEVKPDLLIVCFGCPKQEKWIYENYMKYDATVSICAGATVDFLAGNIKRAPKWMSNFGLEWFYRFVQEPTRMFKRYFVDDVKIIKLIFKYGKSAKSK